MIKLLLMEKPVILKAATINLKEIKKKFKIYQILDTYKEQLKDLFFIRNPQYRFNKNYQEDFEKFVKKYRNKKPLEKCGNWIYFPWSQTLVHLLEEKLFFESRTARNKNVITKEEQEKFYKLKVGIAGLSVGSHGGIIASIMGGCQFMKLADPDTIDISNLNRLSFDVAHLGLNKAEAVAQKIYQINPYAKLEVYKEGINQNNIKNFLDGIDVLIEELDDIEIKYRIREEAKKKRIPVIMLTDNGDNAIIDIERYDLHPKYPIFHGRVTEEDLSDIKISFINLFRVMNKIIDINFVPPRVLTSVLEVGKTIYSWPQLATAAHLSGIVIAYILRKIACGEKIREGKYEVNLDSIIDPDYNLLKNKKLREKTRKEFFKKLGL